MSGELGEAPQPPISRKTGDIGSFNQAAEKVAGLLGSQPEVSSDVEKPYNQEQAQKTLGGIVDRYLETLKSKGESKIYGENLPTWSADDMDNFNNAARAKGLLSEEGATRLGEKIEEYRKTGVFPESPLPPKYQP